MFAYIVVLALISMHPWQIECGKNICRFLSKITNSMLKTNFRYDDLITVDQLLWSLIEVFFVFRIFHLFHQICTCFWGHEMRFKLWYRIFSLKEIAILSHIFIHFAEIQIFRLHNIWQKAFLFHYESRKQMNFRHSICHNWKSVFFYCVWISKYSDTIVCWRISHLFR